MYCAMPAAIAACLSCAAPPSASAVGPSLATSVYETHLGLITLSWSRHSLRVVLRLCPPPSSTPASIFSPASGVGYLDDDADDEELLAFRVCPWLLWRRRSSRRFRAGDRRVDLVWDPSRARFPGSGSPEPSSGFFVAIAVDGEMVLAVGDLPDAAYRSTRARRPSGPRPVLLSRREHVSLRDSGSGTGRGHTTWVNVGGKEREISVDLVARGRGRGRNGREKDIRADVGLSVSVDGERVLHVRRLRWKFGAASESTHALAHAVLVLQFELDAGAGAEEREADLGKDPSSDKAPRRNMGGWGGYLARWGQKDWSETGSNGDRRKGMAQDMVLERLPRAEREGRMA